MYLTISNDLGITFFENKVKCVYQQIFHFYSQFYY